MIRFILILLIMEKLDMFYGWYAALWILGISFYCLDILITSIIKAVKDSE